MLKSKAIQMGFLMLSMVAVSVAQAEDHKGSSGVVSCGGNHFLRNGDKEIQFTAYNIRNFNNDAAITINSIRVFNARGEVLYDSDVSGLPAAGNGIFGPNDNVMEPRQSAQLFSFHFLPFLNQNDRPIQLDIKWSAPGKVIPLSGSITRVSRAYDPVTGTQGEEHGRSSNACENFEIKD